MRRLCMSVLFLTALGLQYVSALSLYVPFTDPHAITADIEGVDESGHTTWRMGQGVPSGSFTQEPLFPPMPSGTVILGSTDAHFIQIGTANGYTASVSGDCGLSGGRLAVCTIVASAPYTTFTTVKVEAITPIEVQLAASVAASATSTSAPSVTSTGEPSTPTTGTTASSMRNRRLPRAQALLREEA
ncbi:hypothetical protein BV20DRAFT_965976 [Pilatotrama ljubarskyi]|nr:hypothetical protein BV20DRAFT_965976 [Pilatotrama ljubarskyi]